MLSPAVVRGGRSHGRFGAPVMAVVAFALALAGHALVAPSTAAAHPLVDEGRRRFEQADFEGALDAFARAESATDLTRDDVIDLLEARALVHLGMGSPEAMRADLSRLVTIAPDHEWDARVAPDVRAAFLEIRGRSPGPLRLVAHAEAVAGGVSVRAEVVHDRASLVRRVQVSARRAGRAWTRVSDAPLVLPSVAGELVEYYAEAIGPGGAVLATAGTSGAPLHAATRARASEEQGAMSAGATSPSTSARDSDGGGLSPWIWIGIGAAVVAAGVLVALLVTGAIGGDPDTQPSPFGVEP